MPTHTRIIMEGDLKGFFMGNYIDTLLDPPGKSGVSSFRGMGNRIIKTIHGVRCSLLRLKSN